MTYRIDQFGTTTLPNYNPESDVGTGEAQLVSSEMLDGGEFDHLGSQKAPVRIPPIIKRCTLYKNEDDIAMGGDYAELRALVGVRDVLYRRMIDGDTLQWVWARLRKIDATRRPGSRYMLDLNLTFVVYSRAWNGEILRDEYEISDVGAGEDDLTTCLAESDETAAVTIVIEQNGDVDQPDVIFTIHAIAATDTITIANAASGHTLAFSGTVDAGDDLVIDCGARSVLNGGADAYNDLTPPATKEEWMVLKPGNNPITITLAGNANIHIEFYDAFA